MPDKITKFIKSLDEKTRQRLKKNLQEIKNNPTKNADIKKLSNFGKNCYRLRVGKIRIIYKVDKNSVSIVDIDWRGNIY